MAIYSAVSQQKMMIFHSYVSLPEGIFPMHEHWDRWDHWERSRVSREYRKKGGRDYPGDLDSSFLISACPEAQRKDSKDLWPTEKLRVSHPSKRSDVEEIWQETLGFSHHQMSPASSSKHLRSTGDIQDQCWGMLATNHEEKTFWVIYPLVI